MISLNTLLLSGGFFAISFLILILIKQTRLLYWTLKSILNQLQLSQTHLHDSVQSEYLQYLYGLLQWEPGKLPATRRWAASPDFLVFIAEWILENHPEHVVELGSGVTSLVISRTLELAGSGRLTSIDHDEVFLKLTKDRLARHNLGFRALLSPINMHVHNNKPWYDIPEQIIDIDMLVIDGPPRSYDRKVRAGAERLFSQLKPNGIILLDDADRPGEQKICQEWLDKWPTLRKSYISTEKGMVILTNNTIARYGDQRLPNQRLSNKD